MFPKLMYEILLLIISLSSPLEEHIQVDFFLENTLAGNYEIDRENKSWAFELKNEQFSMPFFTAVALNESEYRVIFPENMAEEPSQIFDITYLRESIEVFSFGIGDQDIMINEESNLIINRTTINTYFILPEQEWLFVVPNSSFRTKVHSKKSD